MPSSQPTKQPSNQPTVRPTIAPTSQPSISPSIQSSNYFADNLIAEVSLFPLGIFFIILLGFSYVIFFIPHFKYYNSGDDNDVESSLTSKDEIRPLSTANIK
jgi:hypothetical protein